MLSCVGHRAANRLRSDERACEHDQPWPGTGRSHRARRRRARDDHRQAAAPRARVLHIRAEGEAFCLGRERAGRDEAAIRAEVTRLIALKRAVMTSPLITVAEVQGDAAGFGLGLAVLCDFTVVADTAKLSF